MKTEPQTARERASRAVALITCAELPELDPDDRRLVAPLAARGITAVPAVWDDPGVDWSGFDLAVLRSTWDYPPRRDEFVSWAAAVPRLANPAAVIDWNTDKRYLRALAGAGVRVVPTGWVAPHDTWRPPGDGEVVVKPAVGAGSRDCGRYRMDDPEQRRLAAGHVARLQRQDRVVMVQPYLPAVDTHGETALVFLADPQRPDLAYSHAVRKDPMLTGPDPGTTGLFRPERITARAPSTAELALARRVLAAVPGGTGRLLYARVDLMPGTDGAPVLIELELTEPSLFLDPGTSGGPEAADRFAAAIAARSVTS